MPRCCCGLAGYILHHRQFPWKSVIPSLEIDGPLDRKGSHKKLTRIGDEILLHFFFFSLYLTNLERLVLAMAARASTSGSPPAPAFLAVAILALIVVCAALSRRTRSTEAAVLSTASAKGPSSSPKRSKVLSRASVTTRRSGSLHAESSRKLAGKK